MGASPNRGQFSWHEKAHTKTTSLLNPAITCNPHLHTLYYTESSRPLLACWHHQLPHEADNILQLN